MPRLASGRKGKKCGRGYIPANAKCTRGGAGGGGMGLARKIGIGAAIAGGATAAGYGGYKLLRGAKVTQGYDPNNKPFRLFGGPKVTNAASRKRLARGKAKITNAASRKRLARGKAKVTGREGDNSRGRMFGKANVTEGNIRARRQMRLRLPARITQGEESARRSLRSRLPGSGYTPPSGGFTTGASQYKPQRDLPSMPGARVGAGYRNPNPRPRSWIDSAYDRMDSVWLEGLRY